MLEKITYKAWIVKRDNNAIGISLCDENSAWIKAVSNVSNGKNDIIIAINLYRDGFRAVEVQCTEIEK